MKKVIKYGIIGFVVLLILIGLFVAFVGMPAAQESNDAFTDCFMKGGGKDCFKR